MGLTRRNGSYYVEFRVVDDGTVLHLASGGGGKLKRWKIGSLNKTAAKQHEAESSMCAVSGDDDMGSVCLLRVET